MLSTVRINLTNQLMRQLSINWTRQLAIGVPKLQKKISSEKTKLKKLEKDLKIKTKKINDAAKKRQAAVEKKEFAAATKKFRKITAFSFYIKTLKGDLKQRSHDWSLLSQDEKESWAERAQEYNERIQALYPPKPKAPGTGYSNFIKLNYDNDGTFSEISKRLATKWSQLTTEEKEQYNVSQSEKDRYAEALKNWTQQRLQTYQQQKSSD